MFWRGKRLGEHETVPCRICGEQKKKTEVVPSEQVPEPIADIIRNEYPAWSAEGYVCKADLNHFRTDYVRDVLEKERSELALLEKSVTVSMKEHELLLRNINTEFDTQLSFGDHIADRLADFAGSWTFIALFAVIFFVWIAINSFVLLYRSFDPYPFILLNLVLSALAAIQAPVIIMSQNRQEIRDRLHAERDYHVNIHAEMEIHQLHKKIDHLLISQGERLLEIQKIQLELMEDLSRKML
jgi:uncharacterized membrane protein